MQRAAANPPPLDIDIDTDIEIDIDIEIDTQKLTPENWELGAWNLKLGVTRLELEAWYRSGHATCAYRHGGGFMFKVFLKHFQMFSKYFQILKTCLKYV